MRQFMDDNFLLLNETSQILYHDYAKSMPIFDYHCHLIPKEIAEDKKYKSITEIWLGGDHYKWRALRSNGVDEKYITGDADDKEKFMKWAGTMPYLLGNPLYHWTHLELKRFFGIDKLLSYETAEEIWEKCNAALQTDEFSARSLIVRSNVKAVCTTDDPVDSLEYHKAIASDKTFSVKVLPTFRPDKGINIEKPGFSEWVSKLSQVTGIEIKTLDDLKNALINRIEFFHENGCRLSDHALEPVVYNITGDGEVGAIFVKALNGCEIEKLEIEKYKTNIMLFLGRQYARLGWAMQLHIGCLRNNNKKMLNLLGPDTGFDTINHNNFAEALAQLLNNLDETGDLPRTILYSLNPSDNEVLGTITGCFQSGGIPGKMQFGSAWWFNDQKDGMIKQMTALANLGLLSRFIGMLTDSRSFLSYTRHEYFRRIFCNILGEWVQNGEAPNDMNLLGNMVHDVCYNNAKNYFNVFVETK